VLKLSTWFVGVSSLSLCACEALFPLGELATEPAETLPDGGSVDGSATTTDGGLSVLDASDGSPGDAAVESGASDGGVSVAFVGANNALSTSGILAIDRPAGTLPGDYMILAVVERRTSSTATIDDWKTLSTSTAGTNISATIFVRTVGDSEPTSYVVSFGSIATNVGAAIVAYRNVSASTQIGNPPVVGRYNAAKGAVDVPPVDVEQPNSSIVYIYYDSNASSANGWNATLGLNERSDNGYVAIYDALYPNSTPSAVYNGPAASRNLSASSSFDVQALVLPAQ